MSSSYSSKVLPSVRFYGSFGHTFYESDTAARPTLRDARMTSFSFNTSLSLRGKTSIFDDPVLDPARG